MEESGTTAAALGARRSLLGCGARGGQVLHHSAARVAGGVLAQVKVQVGLADQARLQLIGGAWGWEAA